MPDSTSPLLDSVLPEAERAEPSIDSVLAANDQLAPARELAGARAKVKGQPLTTSQAFRRSFMGLSDLTSLNSLPDLPQGTIGGVGQFGGRVVGNREYGDAAKRFAAGQAQPGDADTIALYERHNEIDQQVRKDASFGQRLVLELGGLGKIGQEMAVGGAVLGKVGPQLPGAAGRLFGAGAAGSIPAAPVTSVVGKVGQFAARQAPATALAPSMYVPMAQQRNLELGRDANDPRGYPAAVAYGYANMLVLGQLQKGITGSVAKQALQKGGAALSELQLVDTLAGVADEFLPKAYQFDTHYGNVGRWLEAHRRGDKEGAADVLTDAAVQAIAFSGMAAVHGRGREAPNKIMEAFKSSLDALGKEGLPRGEAGKRLKAVHRAAEEAIKTDPFASREAVLEAAEKAAPTEPLKEYARTLAEAFEPKQRPAEAKSLKELADTAVPDPVVEPEKPTTVVTPEQPAAKPVEVSDTPPIAQEGPAKPVEVQPTNIPAEKEIAKPASIPEAVSAPEAPKPAETRQPLSLSEGKPGAKDAQGNTLTTHDITGPDGKSVGDVRVFQSGGTLRVDWIGAKGLAGGEGRGDNPFGAKELLRLLPELAAKYPDAQVVKYTPAAGRIKAGETKYIDLARFRKSGEAVDRRAAQAPGSPTRRAADVRRPAGARRLTQGEAIRELAEFDRHMAESIEVVKDIPELFERAKARVAALRENPKYQDLRRQANDKLQTVKAGGRSVALGQAANGMSRVAGWNPPYRRLTGTAGERPATDNPGLEKPPPATGKSADAVPPDAPPREPQPLAGAAKPKRARKPKPLAGAGEPTPEPKPLTTVVTPEAPTRVKEREPAKSLKETMQEQFDSMTEADRKEMDAATRQAFKDAGVDLKKRYDPYREVGPEAVVGDAEFTDLPIPAELNRAIAEAGLSKKQAAVLRDAFSGRSQVAVAKASGVSPQAVGQLVERAFAGLKKSHPRTFGHYDSFEHYVKSEKEEQAEALRRKAGQMGYDPETKQPLFSGLPLRLTFLEGLFGRGNSLNASVAKWLKSAGNLPDYAFRAKVERDGRIGAEAQDVLNAVKDLETAVGAKLSSLPEVQLKLLDSALKGDKAALARITSPDVLAAIGRMRAHVDGLSEAMIQNGVFSEYMTPGIEANKGLYLNRSYQVFDDATWINKVPEDVVNRFKSMMAAEWTKDGRKFTDADLSGLVESLLVNGTAAQNPIAFLAKSKLGSKDLSILKGRNEGLAPELRALWGEYENPLTNYVTTVAKMSHLLANHLFLQKVAKAGDGVHFFKDPQPGFADRIADADTEAMKPLAGYHTSPEIARAFQEMYAPKNLPAYLTAYMKALAFTKYSKTVLSPVTHVRNLVSNTGFAIANGHLNVAQARTALTTVVSDTAAAREKYRRLVELQVIGDGVAENEFRQAGKDFLGERADSDLQKLGIMTDKGVVRGLKKFLRLTEGAYRAEDAVWKVYAFENEMSRYKKAYPQWSERQLEAKAAEIVRDTYPTYSLAPRAVKAMRANPLTAPFVTFTSEVVRTTYKTFRLALTELKDPATRSIGATRLAGLTVAAGLSAGLAAMTRFVTGTDADEERAMRRFLPEWSKNSPLWHLGTDGATGDRRYIDMAANDPHAYYTQAVEAALRGKTPEEGARLAAEAVAKNFMDEQLIARRLLDVARNKKEGGGEVYNQFGTTESKGDAVMNHVAGAFVPGGYTTLNRLGKGLAGGADRDTGKVYDAVDESVAALTGVKMQPLELEKAVGFKARQFGHAKADTVGILNKAVKAKGAVSDADVLKAAAEMEAARQKVFDEMARDVAAARTLGMDRAALRKQLKAAGLSDDDASDLLSGTYRPYRPDLSGRPAEERRRLRLLGQPPSAPPPIEFRHRPI